MRNNRGYLRGPLGLLALVLALAPASSRAVEEKVAVKRDASTPTLVIRLQSINELLANAGEIAAAVGQEARGKELEGMVQNLVGPQGTSGLDASKPVGLYGTIGAGGLDSTAVLLLPVDNEKAFLATLEGFNVKAEKGENGLFTVTLNAQRLPIPLYMKFEKGYAQIAVKDEAPLAKGKTLDPATVLAGDKRDVMSFLLRIDQIPAEIKQLALGQFELKLAEEKDKKEPKKSEAEHALKQKFLDQFSLGIKTLLTEGGDLSTRVRLDRATKEVVTEFSLAGKPGSDLAKNIAGYGKSSSLFGATMSTDSVFFGLLHVSLPADVREAFVAVLEEGIHKSLEKEKDDNQREQSAKFLKALEPTLKSGAFDGVLSLHGPKDGHYTVLLGAKVIDGPAIEAALKDAIKQAPPKDMEKVKLNAESAGEFKIHRVDAQQDYDKQAKQLFGDNPVYFAFRTDAVLVSVGPAGLDTLKEALVAKPAIAPNARVELALANLVNAFEIEKRGEVKKAKAVLGDDPDADKIHFVIEGGSALTAKISMKTSVLKFINQFEQLKKLGSDAEEK